MSKLLIIYCFAAFLILFCTAAVTWAIQEIRDLKRQDKDILDEISRIKRFMP